MMPSKRLSRRTLLRGIGIGGVGVSVGLPVLDAMLDGRGALLPKSRAGTPTHPTSLVTFFFPCGTKSFYGNASPSDGSPGDWHPRDDGPAYTPSRNLRVLHDMGLRDQFVPVSGLLKEERNISEDRDAHDVGHATFASGRGSLYTGSGGPTIDWVASGHLGLDTRYRVLPVALGDEGTRPRRYMTWSDRDTPVESYRDPLALYDAIFAMETMPSGPLPSEVLLARRRSVLDFVSEDLQQLTRRVGSNDLRRLDQHFESVRQLERELSTEIPMCAIDRPTETFDDLYGGLSPQRGEVLMKLLVKALECGLTRFASFQLCARGDGRQFVWNSAIGSYDSPDQGPGHHGISHYDDAKLTLCVEEQLREFGRFLELMRDTPAGDASLLYHSLVFFANEHEHGGSHQCGNMPVLLAGQAGGQLTTGRAYRYSGPSARYARLFFNVLGMLGLDGVDFGDPAAYDLREPLPGLEG